MNGNHIVRLPIGQFYAGAGEPRAGVYGLGSCIAVALFDPHARRYGLAHCLLPEQGQTPSTSKLPAKFVDLGITTLVELIESQGGKRSQLMAKLAGGAVMFQTLGREIRPHVGERNIETAHRVLRALGIPLAGEDVGGSEGRSVIADPVRCEIIITTLRGGARVL